ncbi:MAG TPA: DNA polymerase III subunit delta' [Pyrinomonadaceae bacterium]|nr:DNA polymerase III subunit delta' [Pyrinomonadaceae bacterium]
MFADLIGNDAIKHVLRRFVAGRRVPNSLILAGDEGVGKRQFALATVRAMLCRDTTDSEPCGVCSICTRVGEFAFPADDDKDAHKLVIWSGHRDVGTVVPYKRNILVDSIRSLEAEANFRPYEAESRFFIIDDADKMNDAAANALLKTLEEPPDTSHIFLITSRPDSLLQTIRSRCQILRFSPIERADVERHLIEKRAYSHDEARLAAALSHGSIGRAVSINAEEYRRRSERMMTVVNNAIGSRDAATLLKISEEMNDAKNKDGFESEIDLLESLLHDIWRIAKTGDQNAIVNTEYSAVLSRLSEASASSAIPVWIDSIEKLRGELNVNINKKVATDALFVTMAASK